MEDREVFPPYRRAPYSGKPCSLIFPCGGAVNAASPLTNIVLPGKCSTDLALYIVLSGKEIVLPIRSHGTYRPVPEAIQHHSAPSRACESSPKPGFLAHIVFPGKMKPRRYVLACEYRPVQEISELSLSFCPGTHTVLAGKLCRPARELTSSCGGRYIVLLRKVTRNNADLSRKLRPVTNAKRTQVGFAEG